jgi:hypothetical protein
LKSGDGQHFLKKEEKGGWTDLSGIETSVESLVARWVEVGLIDINDLACRWGGRLFEMDRLLF